jgi:hypothetical protein
MQDDRPRVGTAEDVALVGATVTLAFAADPFTRWVWPDAASYLNLMPGASSAFAGGDLASGSAFVVRHGVALFLPPGVEPDRRRLEALCMEHTPSERLADLAAIYYRVGALHPDERYWYLAQLAVDPIAQRSRDRRGPPPVRPCPMRRGRRAGLPRDGQGPSRRLQVGRPASAAPGLEICKPSSGLNRPTFAGGSHS